MKFYAYILLFLSLLVLLSFNPVSSTNMEIRVQIYDKPSKKIKKIKRKRRSSSSVKDTSLDTGVVDFMGEEDYKIKRKMKELKKSSKSLSQDSIALKKKFKNYLIKSRKINLSANVE